MGPASGPLRSPFDLRAVRRVARNKWRHSEWRPARPRPAPSPGCGPSATHPCAARVKARGWASQWARPKSYSAVKVRRNLWPPHLLPPSVRVPTGTESHIRSIGEQCPQHPHPGRGGSEYLGHAWGWGWGGLAARGEAAGTLASASMVLGRGTLGSRCEACVADAWRGVQRGAGEGGEGTQNNFAAGLAWPGPARGELLAGRGRAARGPRGGRAAPQSGRKRHACATRHWPPRRDLAGTAPSQGMWYPSGAVPRGSAAAPRGHLPTAVRAVRADRRQEMREFRRRFACDANAGKKYPRHFRRCA